MVTHFVDHISQWVICSIFYITTTKICSDILQNDLIWLLTVEYILVLTHLFDDGIDEEKLKCDLICKPCICINSMFCIMVFYGA